MRTFLDKIFLRSNNLHNISNNIKELTDRTPIKKIFEVINNYSSESEVRYVGGCIRKIINKDGSSFLKTIRGHGYMLKTDYEIEN